MKSGLIVAAICVCVGLAGSSVLQAAGRQNQPSSPAVQPAAQHRAVLNQVLRHVP